MVARIEKILCTVLHGTHRWQVEEARETFPRGRRAFTEVTSWIEEGRGPSAEMGFQSPLNTRSETVRCTSLNEIFIKVRRLLTEISDLFPILHCCYVGRR